MEHAAAPHRAAVGAARDLDERVAAARVARVLARGAAERTRGPLERLGRRVDQRECIDPRHERRARDLAQDAPVIQLVCPYDEQRLVRLEGGLAHEDRVGEVAPQARRHRHVTHLNRQLRLSHGCLDQLSTVAHCHHRPLKPGTAQADE